MKKFISSLFITFMAFNAIKAQSSIVSLTVFPANPTTTDTIYIYAELVFPNSNCVLDFKASSVNGNNIMAATQHCMGMLPAICSATDTFEIDPLPAGNYNFILTLSSGYGGPPCSPGIVPDDFDTISFIVTGPVGDRETGNNSDLVLFPNPAIKIIDLQLQKGDQQISIYNLTGKIVYEEKLHVIKNNTQKAIDISHLPKALYIIKITGEQDVKSGKLVKQ